jgi:hypothetical protein
MTVLGFSRTANAWVLGDEFTARASGAGLDGELYVTRVRSAFLSDAGYAVPRAGRCA